MAVIDGFIKSDPLSSRIRHMADDNQKTRIPTDYHLYHSAAM